ncbi:MAG TPA: CHAT domain-containing protein, partial [Pyrinomonadaceae bacterium]|nr:CHAT domain-containing protein [Pyrinomonadaceae bacterium]
MTEQIKILFLAANPADRTRLELSIEFRAIQDALLRGKHRDNFELLLPQLAVRIQDFTTALTREQPHIVHFSGHGSVEHGIAFEGPGRSSRPAGLEELTNLFKVLARNTRLIFLNACHTHEQATILGRIFDYTIGTSSRIMDVDAREFSAAFYRALFDGATVPGAFQSAQSALDNRVRAISVLAQRTTADNSVPFVSQVLSHARRKCNFGSVNMQTIVKDNGKVGFIINA